MAGLGSLGQVFYDILANDKTKPGTDSAKQTFVTTLGDIKTAVSSIDQPMQNMAKGYAEMDSYAAQAALSTGLNEAALQGLIRELYSVDTPLNEAGGLIMELGRAGLKTEGDLRTVGNACDTFGDAIGVPADQLANMLIPAMSAFGLKATDIPGKIDGITYTLKNTQVNFSEWQKTLVMIGPDLAKMGLGIDDVNAVLMTLKDRGIQGKDMMQELKKGMDESADANKDGKISLDEYCAALGITTAELQANKSELDGSQGTAEKYADAANKMYTSTEAFSQSVTELSMSLGPLASSFASVSGPLAIVSDGLIAMAALKSIGLGATLSGIGTSLTSLGSGGLAAAAGMGPLLPIIVGLGIGLAAVYAMNELGVFDYIYDAGDKFGEFVIGAGADFRQWLEDLPGAASDAYDGTVDFFAGLPEGIGSAIAGIPETVGGAFNGAGNTIGSVLGGIPSKLETAFSDISFSFDALGKRVQDTFNDVWKGIKDYIGGLGEGFISMGWNIIMFIVQGMKDAGKSIGGTIADIFGIIGQYIPHSPAQEGPLSVLPNFGAYFVDPLLAITPQVQAASLQVAAAVTMPSAQPASIGGGGTQTSTSIDNGLSVGTINAKEQSISDIMAELAITQEAQRKQKGYRSLPG